MSSVFVELSSLIRFVKTYVDLSDIFFKTEHN